MLVLKYMLFVLMGLWLTGDKDLSLQLERTVPVIHPINTVAMGIVAVEIEFHRITGALDTRVLHGEEPFVTSALNALKQWRFQLPAGAEVSRTSVTFLFRPPATYSTKPVTTWILPWMPGKDCPSLPQELIDPGYPVTSVAGDAVILAARIDTEGSVTEVEAIRGIDSLTEQAQFAVKKWRFSPAAISGKRVPSTAFVVISFVLPT